MSTPRDDDALSWDGDDDPTLDVRGDQPRPAPADGPSSDDTSFVDAAPATPASTVRSTPTDETAPTAADRTARPDDRTEDAAASGAMGNAGLIGVGMVAATSLLFAVGWLVAGLRLLGANVPVDDVALLALTIGATLAPPTWFVVTLVLTRNARTWQRFLILVVGVVLLVPWPYLSTGALV